MTREEIAAQIESLALHVAVTLGDTHDLLNYVAAAVRIGGEKAILETMAMATVRAMLDKGAREDRSGQALPPDDLGPYCKECGNDDPKRLACIDNYANGTQWRCEVCGHEFLTGPRPTEE